MGVPGLHQQTANCLGPMVCSRRLSLSRQRPGTSTGWFVSMQQSLLVAFKSCLDECSGEQLEVGSLPVHRSDSDASAVLDHRH